MGRCFLEQDFRPSRVPNARPPPRCSASPTASAPCRGACGHLWQVGSWTAQGSGSPGRCRSATRSSPEAASQPSCRAGSSRLTHPGTPPSLPIEYLGAARGDPTAADGLGGLPPGVGEPCGVDDKPRHRFPQPCAHVRLLPGAPPKPGESRLVAEECLAAGRLRCGRAAMLASRGRPIPRRSWVASTSIGS